MVKLTVLSQEQKKIEMQRRQIYKPKHKDKKCAVIWQSDLDCVEGRKQPGKYGRQGSASRFYYASYLLDAHEVEFSAHGNARDAGADNNGVEACRSIHLKQGHSILNLNIGKITALTRSNYNVVRCGGLVNRPLISARPGFESRPEASPQRGLRGGRLLCEYCTNSVTI